MSRFANPIFCALDTGSSDEALRLAQTVAPHVGGCKIGLEAFYAMGHEGYARIAAEGLPIFLDLKLHDIPNTVAGAVRSLADLEPAILNIHASGGPAMMRAAVEARDEAGATGMALIGVTVLTSLDDADLDAIGVPDRASDQAVRLAALARDAGVDGVVCAAHDIARIKGECGSDFLAVVPGIRPVGAAQGDQKRTLTPREALNAGADVLVVGRPITAVDQPADAAASIARSLAA